MLEKGTNSQVYHETYLEICTLDNEKILYSEATKNTKLPHFESPNAVDR